MSREDWGVRPEILTYKSGSVGALGGNPTLRAIQPFLLSARVRRGKYFGRTADNLIGSTRCDDLACRTSLIWNTYSESGFRQFPGALAASRSKTG
jgi:hypothetical protein